MRALVLLVMSSIAAVTSGVSAAESDAQAFPAYAEVEKAVAEHFGSLSKYQFGDLITWKDVEPLFAKLKGMGWTVADRADIQKQLLSDRDFLVQQLRTRSGLRFMREIARMPGGYDRLDRLRNMPHGKRRIRELVRGPDGHKLIQYMTTTDGGATLGRTLAKAKNGRNFNQPTGRMYTEDQFVAWLKQSYDAEKQRREEAEQADAS